MQNQKVVHVSKNLELEFIWNEIWRGSHAICTCYLYKKSPIHNYFVYEIGRVILRRNEQKCVQK